MPHSLPWFRLYTEARTDRKLSILTLAERGVWVNLLCYAAEQETRGAFDASDRDALAAECADFDGDALDATLAKLVKVRHLVDDGDGRYRFANWDAEHGNPDDGRPPSAVWSALRAAVFARDDYTCRYCGLRALKLECDHVIPVSRGGANDLSNLVTACVPCNRSKHDKTPEEWLV